MNAGIYVGMHKDTQNGFLEMRALSRVKTVGLTGFSCPQLSSRSCMLSDWKSLWNWLTGLTNPCRIALVTEAKLRVNLSVNSEHPSIRLGSLACFPELLTSQQALHAVCYSEGKIFSGPGFLRFSSGLGYCSPRMPWGRTHPRDGLNRLSNLHKSWNH